MYEKWTLCPRPLRRGWNDNGRLARGVLRSGLACLGLVIASSAILAAERPATSRPVLADRLPDSPGLSLGAGGHFSFPTLHGGGQRFIPSEATVRIDRAALRVSSPSGFSDLLLERINREINRLDGHNRDHLDRITPFWAAGEDSHLEQMRSANAERILTKAFDKAVDLRLEQFARTTAGLGPAWNWVETLGSRTLSATGLARSHDRNESAASDSRPRFTAGIGFKVAAHPRMILHTEMFKIRGRIDIPLRDEPMTITVEREIGTRAHVALTSGLSRGAADDWVNLSLRLGF